MGHSLSQIRMTYASSGAIKAAQAGAGAAGGELGAALAESQLGDLLHTVINAQYSQSAELESDAYGYQLMKKYKRNPKAAVSALQKIDKLGESGGIMASHPNSGDRADKIAEMIKSGK
jgi:Zn-dependent protease with chaperone function